MWQRTMFWAGLGGVLCVSAGCAGGDDDDSFNDDTPTPVPTNERPTVSKVEAQQAREGESALVTFTADDADKDPLTVTVQYSYDGILYQPCTPYSGNDNPVAVAVGALGQVSSFEWDFKKDVTTSSCSQVYDEDTGTCPVRLRLFANDGEQDGPAVTTDSYDIPATDDSGGDDDSSSGDDDDTSAGSDLDDVGGDTTLEFNEGVATLELKNEEDNRGEEFLLIVANPGESAVGYTVDRILSGSTSRTSTQARATRAADPVAVSRSTPFRDSVREWAGLQWQLGWFGLHGADFESARSATAAAPTADDDFVVGETRSEFKIIANLADEGEYVTTLGILGAIGDGVLIFVDEDVPIGIDKDCSDTIPPQPDRQGRTTFGFDTCDLQGVADVFDKNILPHLHTYFGNESDVDENSKITVFISPLLNTMTIGSTGTGTDDEEEEEDPQTVPVFVDPEVDLAEFDANENPGSNYQEIIYLSAPDPAGYFNPATGGGGTTAVEEYVSVEMAANIAMASLELISYNAHVIDGGGEPEEDWLKDGLGLLAADLTGFGSVAYDDVAYYLDAPYLYSLTTANSPDSLDDRGVQYLFCRYLVDRYWENDKWKDILSALMTGGVTGTDSVAAAVQTQEPDVTFSSLWLDFLTAIALDGLDDPTTGNALLGDVPGFREASTIGVDDSEYYGAQGYQQGINIRGVNVVRRRSSSGSITETERIRLRGADTQNYAPGSNYYGYVSAGYSGQFTRIGGLIDARSTLEVTASGDGLEGRLVRIADIDRERPPFVVEQVFGSLATDLIQLEIFEDGMESVGLGEIDQPQDLKLTSGTALEVTDTDLYAFDLSDASWSSTVTVLIELNRAISSSTGDAGLEGVLFAVVPLGDLPIAGSISGTYECDGKDVTVYYPGAFLEYLYYQYVLTPTAGVDETYSPIGELSGDPDACNFDMAREDDIGGLLQNDSDEPLPTTLIDQIFTFQVQSLGGKSTVPGFFPYSDGFMDSETVDGDNSASYDLEEGVGGRNVSEGEEAWLLVDLPAGKPENRYVIVVGGESSTGAYELSLRVIDN